MDKNRLIQQIDNLKNDIQNLINRKKTLQDKNEIKLFNEEKKIKISNLKNLTDELKTILKKEKIEVQNQKELRNVLKQVDNLEYQSVSHKMGKTVALDNVKKAKEMREITKNKYLEYLEMEKIYMKYDPLNVPGYIFLHPNILKEYGLCPYMEINTQNENENVSEFIQNLEKSRLEWLKMQKDEGLLYFNLYNDIVNKVKLKQFYKDKLEIEQLIDVFIQENLSESQQSLYNSSEKFLKEWISCSIKTKRLKEKYKNLINNLSILYNETNFEFHNLLSIKHNLQINVNHFNNVNNNSKNSIDDRFQKLLLIDKFHDYIEKYKLKLESINTNEKYIKNTINQLKSDLYIFLTDKKEFYIKTPFLNYTKNKIVQTGKYFKKWTSLSKEEQLERFESFSKYYASKYIDMYNKNEDLSNTLFELLKTSYISKNMIYRDFTWNIKTGCIEKIKVLKYDNENGFILSFTKKSVDNKSVDNKSIDNKSVDNKSVDNKSVDNKSVDNKSVDNKIDDKSVDNKSVDKSDYNKNEIKKKVSSRTIINKDTEKIINEEILYFILRRYKNNNKEYKEYKDEFLEIIKIKLKVKKITSNDKDQICKKYDEILKVVKNNKS